MNYFVSVDFDEETKSGTVEEVGSSSRSQPLVGSRFGNTLAYDRFKGGLFFCLALKFFRFCFEAALQQSCFCLLKLVFCDCCPKAVVRVVSDEGAGSAGVW